MKRIKYLAMVVIVLIAQSAYAQNNCNCRELPISGGENITMDLDDLLSDPEVRICFDKVEPFNHITGTQRFLNVAYDGDLTLSGNQQLSIRNYMKLHVTGTITMIDNASIVGENYGGSIINQLTPGATTISILNGDVNGTVIRDVQLTAQNTNPETGVIDANNPQIQDVTGIELINSPTDPGNLTPTNAEINSVSFNGLRTGIIVDTHGNSFFDLEFFNVATWGDCFPALTAVGTRGTAILLNSNNNEFINIFHGRSEGAVTIWLGTDASHNELLNISVEQEGPQCDAAFGDPAILVPAGFAGENNDIIENFNGATYRGSFCLLCADNFSAYLDEVFIPRDDACSEPPFNITGCRGSESNSANSCR